MVGIQLEVVYAFYIMWQTFVINLDKDTERMTFMQRQLTSLDIPFTRHPAVYGKLYTPTRAEYDPQRAQHEGGHLLTPGEVGCALSHAQVWRSIVEQKIPFTLILEDDVTLPSDFKGRIVREIDRWTQYRWEYLLFDYVPVGIPYMKMWWRGVFQNFRRVSGVRQKIRFFLFHVCKAVYIMPLSLCEGIRNYYCQYYPRPVRFFRPVYFAGAYLVTLEGAEKLLSLAEPVVYTADHTPNKARRLRRLRFFGYCPLIVRQEKEQFGSSILDLAGKDIQLDY